MKKQAIFFYLYILRNLAKLQLKKLNPLVIGVTGSAGKSSCTRAIAVTLSGKYKVKYTKKGNSETGIPLEILGLAVKNYSGFDWLIILFKALIKVFTYWPKYDVLVVEMGIDSDVPPKNMSYLLKIIRPKIGVFLNVNSVHLAYFKNKTLEGIANEKAKLLHSLPKNGLAIYNFDQDEVLKSIEGIRSKIRTFGSKPKADFYLTNHKITLKSSLFTFIFSNKKYEVEFKNQLIFKESFGTFASSLLIANHLGISVEKAINKLEKRFKTLSGRGTVFKGKKKTILIDSSYNSSLDPAGASLRMLSQITSKNSRRVAILGDMRELGTATKYDHEVLARIATYNTDLVITVGPLMRKYFVPELKKKFPHSKIYSFTSALKALEQIDNIICAKDVVLIKGSQNTIFLELITEYLLKNKRESIRLCRRGPYWDKIRGQSK